MLLKFELENFLSFKESQTFYMQSEYNRSQIFNQNVLTTIPSENSNKKHYILNVAAIYGPNGGGKSNFISALYFLQSVVSQSYDNDFDLSVLTPFAFSKEESPTVFTLELLREINKKKYKVKFAISFYNDKIIEEKISYHTVLKTKLSNEKVLFHRIEDRIIKEAKPLKPLVQHFQTRNIDRKSLLSCFIQDINQSFFDKVIRTEEYQIMYSTFMFIVKDITFAKSERKLSDVARKIKSNPSLKSEILLALKEIDVFIEDFTIRDITDSFLAGLKNLPVELKDSVIEHHKKEKIFDIETIHRVDEEQYNLEFYLESDGTKKFISDFIEIFDCLKNGKVYIIDEIENHYHTMIQAYIMNLFLNQNPESLAQMIVSTHNVDFLESKMLAKEQIWFIEKQRNTQASTMYRLSEFPEVTYENHNWKKLYSEGKLGAIPKVIF